MQSKLLEMNSRELVIMLMHIQLGLCDVTWPKMAALQSFQFSTYTNSCKDLDQVCGKLHDFIRACISDALDFLLLLLWIIFYLCFAFVFVILFCLFLAALWPPAVIGLTSWHFYVCFVTYLNCVLGQLWYLIASIPDLCLLPYFNVALKVSCLVILDQSTTIVHSREVRLCLYNEYIHNVSQSKYEPWHEISNNAAF